MTNLYHKFCCIPKDKQTLKVALKYLYPLKRDDIDFLEVT